MEAIDLPRRATTKLRSLYSFCADLNVELSRFYLVWAFSDSPASLLIDGSGNLFGTTSGGRTAGLCPDPTGFNARCNVFELVNSSGSYTEKVLNNFTGPPSDGDDPVAGLITDSSGNLYGTTGYAGSGLCGDITCGTAFELVKSSNGYIEKTASYVHRFRRWIRSIWFDNGFIREPPWHSERGRWSRLRNSIRASQLLRQLHQEGAVQLWGEFCRWGIPSRKSYYGR